MTDKQKQWIAYVTVVIAVLVVGFLGMQYPLPAPPAKQGIVPLGASHMSGPLLLDDGTASAPAFSFTNDAGSGLYRSSSNVVGIAAGGASVGTFSSSGWTGNVVGNVSGTYITSTNVISMSGATFSGPVRYGKAPNYTSGSSIAHGFATTPTVCILWPAEVTATLTITNAGFSSDTATHANPIYWMCGK